MLKELLLLLHRLRCRRLSMNAARLWQAVMLHFRRYELLLHLRLLLDFLARVAQTRQGLHGQVDLHVVRQHLRVDQHQLVQQADRNLVQRLDLSRLAPRSSLQLLVRLDLSRLAPRSSLQLFVRLDLFRLAPHSSLQLFVLLRDLLASRLAPPRSSPRSGLFAFRLALLLLFLFLQNGLLVA